ncbi:MAG TPA: hypothetical protein VNK82_08190 [Terriglobales bacterium]|nr:hypothetical protein [Terriglobales bacterium]
MIFGFNTDVKHGDTVYHVQSEARQVELLLQTQVFVKGQCIGKRAASYAGHALRPDFSEEQMHEMLKSQHRLVLEAIKEGKAALVVAQERDIQDVDGSGLAMRWVDASAPEANGTLRMKLLVTDDGAPVSGARVAAKLSLDAQAPVVAQGTTDSSGSAELNVPMTPDAGKDSGVLVRAVWEGKSATRKFRVKR